jgi:hypothetical protein
MSDRGLRGPLAPLAPPAVRLSFAVKAVPSLRRHPPPPANLF